jgi:DNA-binding transcriptional LysR family regulator
MTEAGFEIYRHATRMIDEGRAIEAAIAGMRNGPAGLLRVTTSMAFGNTQLARLLPGFMERYPDVHVVLHLSDRVVDLVEEGIDVAVRLTPRVTLNSAVARPVGRLRHVLVASTDYVARHGAPASIADLPAHRCLAFGDSPAGAAWTFRVDGDKQHISIPGVLTANSSQSLRMAMLGGAGIALLPTYVVGGDIVSGAALHLLPETAPLGPFGDQLYAVYMQNRFLPHKVRVFIDYLLEKIGDTPDWDDFLR